MPDDRVPPAPADIPPLQLTPHRHGAAARVAPVMFTLLLMLAAAVCGWFGWRAYIAPPWTRDGTVRAYVVVMAPEVAGRVVRLPAVDNALVRKGDVLLEIDPTDYAIAVDTAQANLDQARANATNKESEARRRLALTTLSTSQEERQSFVSKAQVAEAQVAQALASLAQAKVNLERTKMISPVDGFVTNLQVQTGDYAVVGQRIMTLVDSDSFWVDGYFEETALHAIHDGDRARVKLMGWPGVIEGHVEGVARGIQVANATPDAAGLASVNPIFTWVRLAQRIPVRIAIDKLPPGLRLVVGQTASVEIVK
jgi:multidrug resistance efflux pump